MIRLGPGGTAGLGYDEGIPRIAKLGLSALEVEFTHGVNMKNDAALRVGELARRHNIRLSIHAPYFCNLASKEKPKIHATINRVLQSCERGHHMGAEYVVFHAGFYQDRDKKAVYELVKDGIAKIQDTIKEKGWNVQLAPETTGKATQFGDLDELIQLHNELGCHLTVDFSHLRARFGRRDYDEIFSKLKGIKHIHSHFSGIEYSDKGERRHIMTPEKEMRELLQHVLNKNRDITVINESPDPIGDALRTKKILDSML